MMISIKSKADVARYTLLATVFTVVVPVLIAAMVLSPLRLSDPTLFSSSLKFVALVPLLMTPPIAIVLLHVIRLLTETIDRIDDHVKFDHLTGLFNRSHFLDRVRAKREDGVVLIIDADHFKAINDTYGHDAGDEALKTLANEIGRTVGQSGLVGRLGGEEFGAFLPGFDALGAAVMAQRLCKNIRETKFAAAGNVINLTISIGGALHPENTPIGHSLKLADERLYAAKRDGRDRYAGETPLRPHGSVSLVKAV